MKPRYSISVLVLDNLQETKACINSIFKFTENFELIITDNGSGPKTAEYLRKLADENPGKVGIIVHEKNIGFGAGHNRALSFARGDYFVTVNNDLEFKAPWIEEMRSKFRDPRVGQVGTSGTCCMLDENGIGRPGEVVEYVEASCMMIPTHFARELGLFNRKFRLAYCEDVDLSLRVRKRGRILQTAAVQFIHKRAMTAKSLPPETDIEGCSKYNHQVLIGEWESYFRRHSFSEKIVIRRATARGDALLVTPIIRALREQNPSVEIFVETYHPEIFDRIPRVEVLPPNHFPREIDRIIDLDLAYEKDPEKHIVDAYAAVAGVQVRNRLPEIRLGGAPRKWALGVLDPSKPWACFHIGPSLWPGRAPRPERFREVAGYLQGLGWKIFIIGNRDGRDPIGADLDLREGSPTYGDLAALIERSSLFVGIDSLPMHIAQSFKIPIVAVFGCINPEYRLEKIPFFVPVQARGVGCLGCHHSGPRSKTSAICLRDRQYCMEKIQASQLIEAVTKAMEAYCMHLETSKIRDKVVPFLKGRGIDIGCGRDKILPGALGFDDDAGPDVDVIGDASGPMNFPDGAFDFVYSSHCLEDIQDTEATLREWIRILRPGGTIALYVPHPDLYKGVNLEHKHAGFTPEELREVLVGLGIDVRVAETDDGEDRYSTLVIGLKETLCQ